MEKYFKRKATEQSSTPNPQTPNERRSPKLDPPMKKRFLQFELEKLPNDPGLRPKMSDYHPSDRDEIRRYYLQKGPCQPKEIIFPQRKFGDTFCKFNSDWYLKYGSWLEYSQSEDAAYCLCCYLIRSHLEEHKGCGDAFIIEGFTNWKKSEGFRVHLSEQRYKI